MTGRESLMDARSLLSEATPRPWYFDGWDVFSTGPTDETSGHRLVFPLPHPTWHPSQRVSAADAELAVRAVNEYETLLGRESMLREALGELLARGHFDPFLPVDAFRVLQIKRPSRTFDEQNAWDDRLVEFAKDFA